MSQINTPELDLRLAKFLRIPGTSRLRNAEEVLFPTVIMGDLSEDQTVHRIFAAYVIQPLNAALASRVRFSNPTTSKVFVSVRHITAAVAATGFVGVQIEPAVGVGILGTCLSDQLISGGTFSQSVCGLLGDNPAGVAAANGLFLLANCNTGSPVNFDATKLGIRIPPGFALAFYGNAVNQELRVHVIWDEEPIA